MSLGPYSTLGGIAGFVLTGRSLLIIISREMIGSWAVKLYNACFAGLLESLLG